MSYAGKGSREHVIPEALGGTLILKPTSKFWNNFMSVSFERPAIHSSLIRELEIQLLGASISNSRGVPLGEFEYDGETHLRLATEENPFGNEAWIKAETHKIDSYPIELTRADGSAVNYDIQLPVSVVAGSKNLPPDENEKRVEQGRASVQQRLKSLWSTPGIDPEFEAFVEDENIALGEVPRVPLTRVPSEGEPDVLKGFPVETEVRADHVGKRMCKIAYTFGCERLGLEFMRNATAQRLMSMNDANSQNGCSAPVFLASFSSA